MQAMCMACRETVEIPDLTAPRIVNLPTVSLVVIEHPQEFPCPMCGAVLMHGVVNIQKVAVVGQPIPPSERKSLLVMPGGVT